VRRMLLAVATGALGMMVLARVATVLTLAPLGLPEPWELGDPPAAVAPAPAGVSTPGVAEPAPAVAAVVTGLPAAPSSAPRAVPAADRPGTPTPTTKVTRPAAAVSGSDSSVDRQVAASPTAAAPSGSGSDSGGAAARSASSDTSSSSGGATSAPLAKVCLKVVAGICVQLG
jgi:hypothetical protein